MSYLIRRADRRVHAQTSAFAIRSDPRRAVYIFMTGEYQHRGMRPTVADETAEQLEQTVDALIDVPASMLTFDERVQVLASKAEELHGQNERLRARR